jgi:hypothetical protein
MESDLTASEDGMANLSKAPGLDNQASGPIATCPVEMPALGSLNLHLIDNILRRREQLTESWSVDRELCRVANVGTGRRFGDV